MRNLLLLLAFVLTHVANAQTGQDYFFEGMAKAMASDHAGAIIEYDKAIAASPKAKTAYNSRGVSKQALKNYEGAIIDFTRAIQLDPGFTAAYNNRGNAKVDLYDYDGALIDFNKVIEMNSKTEDAYFNRGYTKQQLEDYSGAISDYTKALELVIDEVSYFNRGLCKAKLGNYTGAVEDYTLTIRVNPSHKGVYYARGNAKLKNNDLKGAIEDYDKAIELNPQDDDAINNRSVAISRLKKNGKVNPVVPATEAGDGFKIPIINNSMPLGTSAPNFTQQNVDGKQVTLSSFKGKYVLVYFWASWCRPCRQENSSVLAAYNKYKTKNFTVIGVSFDGKKDDWIQAIKDDHLTWINVTDFKSWNNEVAKLYKVEAAPETILVAPNGKIIATSLRGVLLNNKLKVLLK